MIQLTDLPPETLELIAEKVPRRDHKKMRMVSRQLYYASYCWCSVGSQVRYDVGHKCALKVDPCTQFTKDNISNIWVVERILERTECNWSDGLRCASEKNRVYIVKLLLADGRANPTTPHNWAIRWVARGGYADVVKLLLADNRVDPVAEDNEAIRYASKYGHTEVVKLLLADGRVDPAANDNQAIRWASERGHTKVVNLLLADGHIKLP